MKRTRTMWAVILVAVTFLFISASPAFALPYYYDFTGNAASNPLGLGTGNLGTSVDVVTGPLFTTGPPLEMTIYGEDRNSNNGASANIHRTAVGGLGVVDGAGGNTIGKDESIFFDFSPHMVVGIDAFVLEIDSGQVGQFGRVDLYVDGLFDSTHTWEIDGNTSTIIEFAGIAGTGNVLEFRGVSNPVQGFGNTRFRVQDLVVDYEPVPVPEPGSLLLLGTGFVGLVCWSRKRREG